MKNVPYFFGNLLADFVLYLVPTICFIILLFPMKIDAFTSKWQSILCLMICFGFGLITMTYLMSYLFTSSNRAFRLIGAIYIFIGYVIPVAISSILMAA